MAQLKWLIVHTEALELLASLFALLWEQPQQKHCTQCIATSVAKLKHTKGYGVNGKGWQFITGLPSQLFLQPLKRVYFFPWLQKKLRGKPGYEVT